MSLVSKKKIDEVNERLVALGVDLDDLDEDFIKGGGKGGQKINKTNNCVQLTYLKTGLVIKCQKSRSREQNRFYARRELLERIEEEQLGKESEKQKRIFKIKAQKRKRRKRAQEKVLENKKKQSEKKQSRKKPGLE